MSIPDTVTELLEPVVATLDVELLDVEWNGNSLRVVVDRVWPQDEVADKTNGITTQQLADVNRLISPILDQHDPVPGRYTLEVSSPGVERKLTKPEHYRRAVGENVVVKLMPQLEPRRVKGELLAIDVDTNTIQVVGAEIDGVDQADPAPMTLDLASIQKARTSFNWGPTPKPGGPKPKGAKKKPAPAGPSRSDADDQTEQPNTKQAQLNTKQAQLNRDKDPS